MTKRKRVQTAVNEVSRKRPYFSPPKPERNVLNENLLNLYKKDTDFKKEKSSSSQDESIKENKSKENDTDTSKTPSKSGRRSKIAAFTPKMSSVSIDSIGGMDEVFKEIMHMFMHYKALPFYKEANVSPVSGILLHGPPGCGKTCIIHAIARAIGVPIIEVSATELVCGISGESESMIRDMFAAALAVGRCILFIDEIDAICRKRETNENAMLGRMVTQMIKSFDELRSQEDPDCNIVVIGATNMLDSLDNALRQGSRFTHEVAIGMPDEEGRLEILKTICKNLSPDFNFRWLAHHTPGYVGADLKTLLSNAYIKALNRRFVSLPPDQSGDDVKKYLKALSPSEYIKWFHNLECSDKKVTVMLEDFKVALQEYVPTSKREGFATVPETTWDEIGSYKDIKEIIQQTILWPVQDNAFYESNKLLSSKGVLLYGPKGCGKTLIAKAIANECNVNFLTVNGPELLNMYVGESERAVRTCFARARNAAPCIIFFDEFDAFCPRRSNSRENGAVERVVNQLLTEASGISEREQVFLIAATNRLDKIDSAMLRPGRFDMKLYVGLPTPAGRVEILKSHLKDRILEEGFKLEKIAFDPRCEHFSGADISNLVDTACSNAVKELKNLIHKLEGKLVICMKHFVQAFTVVKPSVSEQERRYYEKISAEQSKT